MLKQPTTLSEVLLFIRGLGFISISPDSKRFLLATSCCYLSFHKIITVEIVLSPSIPHIPLCKTEQTGTNLSYRYQHQ